MSARYPHLRRDDGRCRNPPCGDGVLDQGEVCDDGNTDAGGCNPTCTKVEVCGDGVTDPSELCDDANANPNDGCNACGTTSWTTTVVLGNGVSASQNVALQPPLVADRHGRIFTGMAFCRIGEIDPDTGGVNVIAVSGTCHIDADGNGNQKQARGYNIGQPTALALDPDGNLYFADAGYIRFLDRKTGVMTWVAGIGTVCASAGECGSGTSPRIVPLAGVTGLAVAADDSLYSTEGW